MELTGLAVSVVQAKRIKSLWDDALDMFDKRATEVHLRSQQGSLL